MKILSRRMFLGAVASVTASVASLGLVSSAHAAEILPLTQENWDSAIGSGKPVAVRFYETWCPNCTSQGRALKALINGDDSYRDFIVLEGPFGENRGFAGQFGIRQRTSIALVKGDQVVDTIVGETRESNLRTFLDQAL